MSQRPRWSRRSCEKSTYFKDSIIVKSQALGLKLTNACDLLPVGVRARAGHLWSASVCETRVCVCVRDGLVGMCVSRLLSVAGCFAALKVLIVRQIGEFSQTSSIGRPCYSSPELWNLGLIGRIARHVNQNPCLVADKTTGLGSFPRTREIAARLGPSGCHVGFGVHAYSRLMPMDHSSLRGHFHFLIAASSLEPENRTDPILRSFE